MRRSLVLIISVLMVMMAYGNNKKDTNETFANPLRRGIGNETEYTLVNEDVSSLTITKYQGEVQRSPNMKSMNDDLIFAKGDKAPSDWFTGDVWVKTLMNPNDNLRYVISDVKFAPKARTNWHVHPVEQVLMVTDGTGFYQEEGKTAQRIAKGDVVVVPPMVKHWHGAAKDSRLIHIAITNYKDGVNVEWLEAVADALYDAQ